MKTNTLLLVAGVAVVGYLVLSKKAAAASTVPAWVTQGWVAPASWSGELGKIGTDVFGMPDRQNWTPLPQVNFW